jgi:hypothetical protein
MTKKDQWGSATFENRDTTIVNESFKENNQTMSSPVRVKQIYILLLHFA